MTQRRVPSGQGPARRPGGRRGSASTGHRSAGRDRVDRLETRRASTRTATTRGAGGPRSTSRPAAARRAAAGGAARRTSAPQPSRFTGRASILCAVLVALALTYTYPVRRYLNQQAEIARLEAAQAAQREHIRQLSEKADLWQDPEYIRTQARQRFFMVEPGEKPLLVLWDPNGAARDAGADPRPGERPPSDAWYDTLWASIRAANEKDMR